MALELKNTHLESIRTHGSHDYPSECCGMLLGKADGDSKVVAEVVPLTNLRHDPARAQDLLPLDDMGRETEKNRFLIDPLDQLRFCSRLQRGRAAVRLNHAGAEQASGLRQAARDTGKRQPTGIRFHSDESTR